MQVRLLKSLRETGASALVMALVAVPLNDSKLWTQVNYSSIPGNQVLFSKKGMTVKVKASASPLVYKIPSTQKVKKVSVEGELKGRLKLKEGIEQGFGENDDFVFRIGLVVPGERKLNFFQRMAAASWVKTLFKLAPKDQGLKEILFLNAVQDQKLLGKKRSHPKSELLKEHYIWHISKEGKFKLTHTLPEPVLTSALWLSLDGDESQSNFEVIFEKIKIEN